jgi:hypothetical protein
VYSGTSRPPTAERSDHIELLAVQILPATANSIRNEDILHTGDQVSPTSQTVAGPPRHQTRLECAFFDRATQVHDTASLAVRQRHEVPAMAFLQCQLSVLCSPALRV